MIVFRMLGLVLLLTSVGYTQTDVPPSPPPLVDSVNADTLAVDSVKSPAIHRDTILFQPAPFGGELSVSDSTNLEARLRQNPTGALFKSLVIPGWGQVGNGRYTKAVIFAGLQGWCVGAAIHYGKSASHFKDLYNAAPVSLRNDYYNLYKDRRQERNKYYFFLGLTTLVSVFDAYVDAHLSGSPITQTKKVGVLLEPESDGMAASLAFRF